MDWSRTNSVLDLGLWLAGAYAAWGGGWLLCLGLFRLKSRERLMAGLSTGLLLWIVLGNLLFKFMPPVEIRFAAAMAAAPVWVLGAGLFACRRRRPAPLLRTLLLDLRRAPWVGALALFALFLLINAGLAIYDDYHNLPLTSIIAAGEDPARFYLDPRQPLAYHYGLHLLAGSLVRLGGLFPWSAFDLVRALTLTLTVTLAWLWFYRLTGRRAGANLGAAVALLAGGARWLMLFVPGALMLRASARVQMIGTAAQTSPSLFESLLGVFPIEGAGNYAFPFAYMNGIFSPLPLALGGSAAAPWMTVLLLMLLFRRRWTAGAGLVFGLLLGSLAITAETIFVLLWAGFALAAGGAWLNRKAGPDRRRQAGAWLWPLGSSALLALVSGGVPGELLRRSFAALGGQPVSGSAGFSGFTLHAPTALLSAHLGRLSLLDPLQLMVLFLEAGPAVLLIPLALAGGWRALRRGRVLAPALAIAILLGLVVPLFVGLETYERDISRLTGASLYLAVLFTFPGLWRFWHSLAGRARTGAWLRFSMALGALALLFGGLVILAVQITAIPLAQASYFVAQPDAAASRQWWNRLERGQQVFDPLPYRSVTLFGRPVQAYQTYYLPLEEWGPLVENPDPAALAAAGFNYMYFDEAWWLRLPVDRQEALVQPCVVVVSQETHAEAGSRWLLDIRACLPENSDKNNP